MIIVIELRCQLTLNADICINEQCWCQWAQESVKHNIKSVFLKQWAEECIIWWWQVSQWDLSV